MSNQISRRRKVRCEINREIGESVLRLQDYAKDQTDKHLIVEKTFSLLMFGLIYDDRREILDGFERVQEHMTLTSMFDRDKLFGEFLLVLNFFLNLYGHLKYLTMSLEELLPQTPQDFPEDMFSVEWSRAGHILQIS